MQESKTASRYMRGAVLQFHLSGFPRTFVSELVRQLPLLLCIEANEVKPIN